MSLFGAMNTAISGLNAQSNAFGNISDNVANSQTVGYKRVDTSFIDYLTTSNASRQRSGLGGGAARLREQRAGHDHADPTIRWASPSPDRGSSPCRSKTGEANNVPTFNPQQYYTRAGDFQMDKNGYLVNSANEALNGWPVNPPTGVGEPEHAGADPGDADRLQSRGRPPTVTLSANLPATPAADTATAARRSRPISTSTMHWAPCTP